jgi:hypothetical protein
VKNLCVPLEFLACQLEFNRIIVKHACFLAQLQFYMQNKIFACKDALIKFIVTINFEWAEAYMTIIRTHNIFILSHIRSVTSCVIFISSWCKCKLTEIAFHCVWWLLIALSHGFWIFHAILTFKLAFFISQDLSTAKKYAKIVNLHINDLLFLSIVVVHTSNRNDWIFYVKILFH